MDAKLNRPEFSPNIDKGNEDDIKVSTSNMDIPKGHKRKYKGLPSSSLSTSSSSSKAHKLQELMSESLMKFGIEMKKVIKSDRSTKKQNKVLKLENASLLKSKSEYELQLKEKEDLIAKHKNTLEVKSAELDTLNNSLALQIELNKKLQNQVGHLHRRFGANKGVKYYLHEIAHYKAKLLSKSNELEDKELLADKKIKSLEEEVQNLRSKIIDRDNDLRLDLLKNLVSHHLIERNKVENENIELRSTVKGLTSIIREHYDI